MRRGAAGFMAPHSHAIVAITRCEILHPELERVRARLADQWTGPRQSLMLEYDAVRELVIVSGEPTDELNRLKPIDRARIDRDGTEFVRRLVWHPTLADTDGAGPTARAQTDPEAVEGVYADAPAGGFSQAHALLNRSLQSRVVSMARSDGRRVVDLFCGYGNLSFPHSGARSVVGFEGAAPAVRAAAKAAAGSIRFRFFTADLNQPSSQVIDALGDADVVVTDPPRAGMSDALCDAICASRADTLVYVACHPQAMARDAVRLARGSFRPESGVLLDMFPRTSHVEAVVHFTRPTP